MIRDGISTGRALGRALSRALREDLAGDLEEALATRAGRRAVGEAIYRFGRQLHTEAGVGGMATVFLGLKLAEKM